MLDRGIRHYRAFRMDHDQLPNIVQMFQDDPIFQSLGRKAQAPPLYQIGLLIYRKAHGHSMHVLESLFHVYFM